MHKYHTHRERHRNRLRPLNEINKIKNITFVLPMFAGGNRTGALRQIYRQIGAFSGERTHDGGAVAVENGECKMQTNVFVVYSVKYKKRTGSSRFGVSVAAIGRRRVTWAQGPPRFLKRQDVAAPWTIPRRAARGALFTRGFNQGSKTSVIETSVSLFVMLRCEGEHSKSSTSTYVKNSNLNFLFLFF